MAEKMKILIAYDGIHPFSGLIKDLQRAGLPKAADVIVMTVVDAYVPPSGKVPKSGRSARIKTGPQGSSAQVRIQAQLETYAQSAQRAAGQLKAVFPGWKVRMETAVDSPAWAVIKKSESWKAKLVVVEAHHRPRLAKIFFGSVAQKIVTEARCSVRVVHDEPEEVKTPVRLVIAVDGSEDCARAVEAAAARAWKKGSSVRLLTVTDVGHAEADIPTGAPRADGRAEAWIRQMQESFEKKLRAAGLSASSVVRKGEPSHEIVTEARKWGADSVFIGARGLQPVERFLMGSVSASVAAGAPCSVEVIR